MSDRQYLRRRATQEEELASTAKDETAAVIHSAMAAEYRRRLLEIDTQRRSRPMRSVAG
jgi:hypothetical protein